jgi:hypothetical protein
VTLQRILTRGFVALLLVQAVIPTARAGGEDASPSPVAALATERASTPAAGPLVWLRGPFGRVAGGTLDDPGTAPPGDQPLGTLVRRAPLVLEATADLDVRTLAVAARSLEPVGAVERLSDGALVFEGPDGIGQHIVVADVTSPSGVVSQHAWLVYVPDVQPPPDGFYDIPAPQMVLMASGGSIPGHPGSGCYAYLCVDVGHPPPVAELPVLKAGIGESLSVRPDDGSAIAAWDGRLTSIDDPAWPSIRADTVLVGPLEDVVDLSGLEPPAAGRWRLDLEVEFDRERGWMRTFYVLDVR